MTEERKHEIESIIDNAITDEDCKEWAAGNMTDNVSALVNKYRIKQLNIWDDVCEIVEFYPESETRKEQVERETREFLIKVLVETYNIKPEKAPDYISEFFWVKTCLYASIDKLRNPAIVATMKCGVIF